MLGFRKGLSAAMFLIFLISLAGSPGTAADQELVFYSTIPRNFSDALVKGFQAKNPEIKVDMFQASVEIVLAKLELEIRAHGRPKADVIWFQDPTAMERLSKGGQLERYVPRDASQILPVYRDPQGNWTGTLVTHALLMYNTQAIPREKAPKSWKDLADPRFKDKIILADPRISGVGATIVTVMLQRYGWRFWEDVAKNRPHIVPSHAAMVSLVIAGERHLGPMVDFSIFEPARKGSPITFTFPEEGAIAIGGYVGIIKGTSATEPARKFVDFFASKDAAATMRSLGMYSTRNDSGPPEGWPPIEQIKLLKVNWEEFARNLPEIKKRFTEIMRL